MDVVCFQVLRSKGFVWMSNSHATAFYWSHAGQHFEIRDEGDWWAAVDDEDWPEDEEQQKIIVGEHPHPPLVISARLFAGLASIFLTCRELFLLGDEI